MTQEEMKAQEKITAAAESEQTRPGPVFAPAVDIFETEDRMTLTADMPGVTPDELSVDLKDNTLTLRGRVNPVVRPNDRTLFKEYETGDFFRQFTLSEMIDQEKISAKLKNGVLTLDLPKVAPAKPRQVPVTAE